MKEQLAQLLRKFPALYDFVSRSYNALRFQRWLERIEGTKFRERYWRTFARNNNKGHWVTLYHPKRTFMLDRITMVSPLSSILEVGSSGGPNLYHLAKRFPNAVIKGVDINPYSIEYGEKRLAEEGITNVELSVAAADDLGQFKDQEFDVTLTMGLLICIGPDKIERVIKELIRVTRRAVFMMEWHYFESKGKDSHALGVYHKGYWERDYNALLKRFVGEDQMSISITKLPEEWNFWPDCGAIVEVIFRSA